MLLHLAVYFDWHLPKRPDSVPLGLPLETRKGSTCGSTGRPVDGAVPGAWGEPRGVLTWRCFFSALGEGPLGNWNNGLPSPRAKRPESHWIERSVMLLRQAE